MIKQATIPDISAGDSQVCAAVIKAQWSHLYRNNHRHSHNYCKTLYFTCI